MVLENKLDIKVPEATPEVEVEVEVEQTATEELAESPAEKEFFAKTEEQVHAEVAEAADKVETAQKGFLGRFMDWFKKDKDEVEAVSAQTELPKELPSASIEASTPVPAPEPAPVEAATPPSDDLTQVEAEFLTNKEAGETPEAVMTEFNKPVPEATEAPAATELELVKTPEPAVPNVTAVPSPIAPVAEKPEEKDDTQMAA
ncbi:hypothetical protein HOD30_00580 [Candidatus Peregrinibacteria bacterium]|jgi:hypothetical protein|nr:hypothetical protein [Candidatus Peregrinibacteria bacterium]MBT4631962.1 hypothetical protein [Candidatus Peregrinibacteria bacterium]MBT5516968.1 hypothetical protein [Candidatus Peregrinibacteria bacterium]MBT5823649.1 hypothetical protein [Candidatus Peregrinibacteria bacterium]